MKVEASSVNVRLRSGKLDLQEYDDNEDERRNARTGVKFVEAPSGSTFSIICDFALSVIPNERKAGLSCELTIDGQCATSRVTKRSDGSGLKNWYLEINGIDSTKDGKAVLEKFTFANLVTNEASAEGLQSKDFRELGEIKAELRLTREVGAQPTKESEERASHLRSKHSIPEKCLKGRAISSRTSLAEPEELRRVSKCTVVEYPWGKKPFATYIFKYRSRRDLQIENIIPRSSPAPEEGDNGNAESDDDIDNLTPEEMRERLRDQRRQERAQRLSDISIKREKRERDSDNDEDQDEPTVVESRNKRTRISDDSGVEIIDLCGEDG